MAETTACYVEAAAAALLTAARPSVESGPEDRAFGTTQSKGDKLTIRRHLLYRVVEDTTGGDVA
jgi:hypothetical protein